MKNLFFIIGYFDFVYYVRIRLRIKKGVLYNLQIWQNFIVSLLNYKIYCFNFDQIFLVYCYKDFLFFKWIGVKDFFVNFKLNF